MFTAKAPPLKNIAELTAALEALADSEKEREFLLAEFNLLDPISVRRPIAPTFQKLSRLRREFGPDGSWYIEAKERAISRWPELEMPVSIAERADLLGGKIDAVRQRCKELQAQIEEYQRRTNRHGT
jgi:hypothetical protein